jgi:hypothetical protein
MRAFIGYALVVVGLPHAVGLLAGLPFARFFLRLTPPGQTYRIFAVLDLINGLGCLAAAVFLFWLLSLQMTLALPIVLSIRSAVYFSQRSSFLWASVMWSAFSAGGWLTDIFSHHDNSERCALEAAPLSFARCSNQSWVIGW